MNLLFYLSIFFVNISAPTSFYDLQFNTLDGAPVNTSSFHGKKVVIAVISGSEKGANLARHLDGIQRSTANIQVIAVPTDEFNGSILPSDLTSLKSGLSIIVTQPIKTGKERATQHPLFKWLTGKDQNSHFDMDVDDEGQVFLISENGRLYGVFPGNTPQAALDKIIGQPIND